MSSIVLIGPPGAGKGTQREKIVAKYGFKEIIPGDIMREEVKNKTEDGLILAEYINKGLLAPHKLAMKVVKNKIVNYFNDGIKNIIFDGFPREVEQMNELATILDEYKIYSIKKVIFFKLSDDIVKERIKHRAINSGRADDASSDITETRLNEYYSKTTKVINIYKEQGLVEEIDASKTPEEVFSKVDSLIKNILI